MITQCVKPHTIASFIHHLITMRRPEPGRTFPQKAKVVIDRKMSAVMQGVRQMAQENRSISAVAPGVSSWRVLPARSNAQLQPTTGAQCIDLRGSFRSAQMLAGTGALVFEGELLEGVRLN